MIRHVVALQLHASDPVERRRLARDIKTRLEALRGLNEGVLAIDVHLERRDAPPHWPLVLIADFADEDSLDHYQSHARHRDVLDWLNGGVVSDRAVVDFEIDLGPESDVTRHR